MPLFPYLSLLLAIGLDRVLSAVFDVEALVRRPFLKGVLVAVAAGAALAPVYLASIDGILTPRRIVSFEHEGDFMRSLRRDRPELTHDSAWMEMPVGGGNEFYGQLHFYVDSFRRRGGGGSDVTIIRGDGQVDEGDLVLSCSKPILEKLRAQFQTTDEARNPSCALVRLVKKK